MHASISKLSPKNSGNVSRLAEYYTRTTKAVAREWTVDELARLAGYYAGAEHASELGQARWFGQGVGHLGLEEGAQASADQVRRLLIQRHPDTRENLRSGPGHAPTVAGLDFTIAAEKDLSVLYLLADAETQEKVLAIMQEASTAALREIELRAAVVRRGAGGALHRSASGFVALRTLHAWSRPVEGTPAPHLHEHIVIMNLAEADGRWSSLDAHRLFEFQKLGAAVAGQIVREKTAALFGISWEQDENGVQRIAGFDAALRKKLSPRQRQIIERAAANGADLDDRDAMIAAQRSTREAKGACDGDPEQIAHLIEELRREGVTYKKLLRNDLLPAAARAQQAEFDRYRIIRKLGDSPTGVEARDWYGAAVQLFLHEGSHEDAVQRVEAALAADVRPDEERIADALETVGRRKSTWRRVDLETSLLDEGFSLSIAKRAAEEFISDPKRVVYIGGIEDTPSEALRIPASVQPLYATVETLRREEALLRMMRDGAHALAPQLTEDQFAQVLDSLGAEGIDLSTGSDQRAALQSLLLDGNTITLVSGMAGTGKTTVQRGLWLATNVSGGRIFGAALTATAAQNLCNETGIESQSLQMLSTMLHRGDLSPQAGDILVVDEVSQASTYLLHDLTEAFVSAGGRVVLVGDQRQLQAVEAGGMFRTMMQENTAVAYLRDIRRQRNLHERAVLSLIHDNFHYSPNTREALLLMGVEEDFLSNLEKGGPRALAKWYITNDRIRTADSAREAMASLARDYWHFASQGKDETPLVIAKTNREVVALDRAIVEEGARRGLIDPSATLDFGGRSFFVGQRITTRKIDRRGARVLNGEQFEVIGITNKNSYKVTFDTHTHHGITQTMDTAPKAGSTLTVTLTPKQVQNIRTNVQKSIDFHEKRLKSLTAPAARLRAEEGLRKSRADAEWAAELPTEGGPVQLVVRGSEFAKREPHLEVRGDDGTTRLLPEKYVAGAGNVDSGYVTTRERAQGRTMSGQVGALLYGTLDYVSASRAKRDTRLYFPLDTPVPDEKQEEREKTERDTIALLLDERPATERRDALVRLGSEQSGIEQLETARRAAREQRGPVEIKAATGATVLVTPSVQDTAAELLAQQMTDHAVIVVATPEMAKDFSAAAVQQTLLRAEGSIRSQKIGDESFIPGQPVILTHESEDAGEGTRAVISGLTDTRVALRYEDGRTTVLSHEQFRESAVSAIAVTFRQVGRMGLDPDVPVVVDAAGIRPGDLDALRECAANTTVVYTDPDLDRETAHDRRVLEAVEQHLTQGAGLGKMSALDQLDRAQTQELGLRELQAEVRFAAIAIDSARRETPESLARKDLLAEESHLLARMEELNLQRTAGEEANEVAVAAARALDEVDAMASGVRHKLEVLSGRAGTSEEKEAIVVESQLKHAEDELRLAAAEKRMERFVQERVTRALVNPAPYVGSIPKDQDLPPEDRERAWRETLVEVEAYRVKWGVRDSYFPLGPDAPAGGIELEEWRALDRRLHPERAHSQHRGPVLALSR